jgi:hypothetical protein
MIKRLPQRPSRKHLKESAAHLLWLESLGSVGTELIDIAPALVSDFAKQARTADVGELKDFSPAKRYTLRSALIHSTKARTRDAVAGTVVKRIATFHKRARNELLERQIEQRERVDRLLGNRDCNEHIGGIAKASAHFHGPVADGTDGGDCG